LPPPPDVTYPRNSHPGVDLFVADDMDNIAVKSVDTGIVVGIGVSRIDENGNFADVSGGTHFYWGSAIQRVNQVRTPGYSVIVRHGHLYMLYGHLSDVKKDIWVGAYVQAGTTLGILGLFNERHLHIEVHSYGHPTILDGISESEASLIGQHGILPVAQQAALMVAPYVYDMVQMLPTPLDYSPTENNNLTFPQLLAS
jgi:murein DD-endopeptidase MepM/ murein hydrolase activator NlpD